MSSSSSSSRCCATGVFLVPSLLLLPLLLSVIYGAQGATLREHRLSGTEPASYGPASQMRPPPSAEMLQALRYIQSLSQRTPADPDQSDQQEEDMESVRSMLKMASPTRREEKDNTQELLQAVLTTLQQTEEHMKTPQKVIATPRYHQFARPKQQVMKDTNDENYGRNPWANTENRRRYREYPIMFEDDQPLKRTNENAEEQYTPQKLATLQSVFEELSGIASSKSNTKRNDDDDEDLYRQRKMVLDDIMGTDDWTPLEEQMESEEEERERHGFTRNLEDDDDDDDVKRSLQSDWLQTRKEEEEPEDMAKLVDYYLLQMLEKKEQKQQKRQEDDEEDEVEKKDEEEENVEERDVKPMPSLSEVLKISQKLRILPEELLEPLRNENPKDLPGRTGYVNAHKTFASAPHQRPIETSDIAQDILSILELANAAQQNQKRPTQVKNERYYKRQATRDDYDDTAGEEDELASYLAKEMQRHTRMTPLRDEDQPANLQNYYEKQPAEHETAATGIDNSTMMKILRLLDPESDDADKTDSYGEKVPEM